MSHPSPAIMMHLEVILSREYDFVTLFLSAQMVKRSSFTVTSWV